MISLCCLSLFLTVNSLRRARKLGRVWSAYCTCFHIKQIHCHRFLHPKLSLSNGQIRPKSARWSYRRQAQALATTIIGQESFFTLFSYQQDFLEVSGVLLSPHLLEDMMESSDPTLMLTILNCCCMHCVLCHYQSQSHTSVTHFLGMTCIPPLIQCTSSVSRMSAYHLQSLMHVLINQCLR